MTIEDALKEAGEARDELARQITAEERDKTWADYIGQMSNGLPEVNLRAIARFDEEV